MGTDVKDNPFTDNEVALLVVLMAGLESWAGNYLAWKDENKSGDDVIEDFNEAALKQGIVLATIIEAYPEVLDHMDRIMHEAESLDQTII